MWACSSQLCGWCPMRSSVCRHNGLLQLLYCCELRLVRLALQYCALQSEVLSAHTLFHGYPALADWQRNGGLCIGQREQTQDYVFKWWTYLHYYSVGPSNWAALPGSLTYLQSSSISYRVAKGDALPRPVNSYSFKQIWQRKRYSLMSPQDLGLVLETAP